MTTDSPPGRWNGPPSDGSGAPDPGPDGPPPTPTQRRRQRRRRRIEWSIAIVLIVALVPSLVWLIATVTETGASTGTGEQPAEDSAGSDDESGDDVTRGREGEQAAPDGAPSQGGEFGDRRRPDTPVPPDEAIEAPDPSAFRGAEAELLRVLMDIDASERAMLGFQVALLEAIDQGMAGPDLLEVVSSRATIATADLSILRELLGESIDDPDTRLVAERYVAHLDTWVDYLAVLEEQPELLGGDMVRYTLPINATGGQFSLAVEARLSADLALDERIVAYAREIVERGFPPPDQAQV